MIIIFILLKITQLRFWNLKDAIPELLYFVDIF
jgi:hypothetical protein